MTTSHVSQGTDRAQQTLALLPVLRRWVTARVHWVGADADLSLRQYAALTGIQPGRLLAGRASSPLAGHASRDHRHHRPPGAAGARAPGA